MSWLLLTSASSARPPKLVSNPQIRCCGSSIVSSWPSGSSSSTDRQCATTLSPAFHLLTPGPTASTTPARSDPTTWYGRSCRLDSSLSRPYRSRNPNVDTGSKIEGQTVLKFTDEAITATIASPGPSSGVATSSTCRLLRGSLSRDARPSNIPTSSLRTTTPRYDSGIGIPATPAVSPVRTASRISFIGSLSEREQDVRTLPTGSHGAV